MTMGDYSSDPVGDYKVDFSGQESDDGKILEANTNRIRRILDWRATRQKHTSLSVTGEKKEGNNLKLYVSDFRTNVTKRLK